MMNKYHQFHMITMSPWPIINSLMMWNMMNTVLSSFNMKNIKYNAMLNYFVILSSTYYWWSNTMKEANKEGFHHKSVMKGLKLGMILFITSEVLFFLSFFWSYFHFSISPSMEIGQSWPPTHIESFNPYNVPLLNTIILISSGVSITWSHHSIYNNNYKQSFIGLTLTCILGLYFSTLQFMEYQQASFTISESSYSSIFFMATGFHGFHVLIGTTFLLVNLVAMKHMYISKTHHIGFEMAAWYWHFVDLVWLFLYLSIYCWGK